MWINAGPKQPLRYRDESNKKLVPRKRKPKAG